jgi:hypothetical protein
VGAPPAGGVALPVGDGEPTPEPVVLWTCKRSRHCDVVPTGFASSHCAMVWKLHCACPVGPFRQYCPDPICATDGVVSKASVTADAAVSVRMISPSWLRAFSLRRHRAAVHPCSPGGEPHKETEAPDRTDWDPRPTGPSKRVTVRDSTRKVKTNEARRCSPRGCSVAVGNYLRPRVRECGVAFHCPASGGEGVRPAPYFRPSNQ